MTDEIISWEQAKKEAKAYADSLYTGKNFSEWMGYYDEYFDKNIFIPQIIKVKQ